MNPANPAKDNTAPAAPLLEIDGLKVSFDAREGRRAAVDSVSLSIYPGETLGLVGESGCGKSVTAMSILRLLPSPPARIERGSITFNGIDVLSLDARGLEELRGSAIGVIFQDPMTSLSPLHRIGDQVSEAARIHNPGMTKAEARALALDMLRKVGLPDPERLAQEYPHQLSGGQQQRVMIAGALSMAPKLLIADEPTTALDVTIQLQILELMREVKGTDAALLLITHDMGVIRHSCQRVAVMYAGEIVELMPVSDLAATARHPYTRALLSTLPSADTRGRRLPAIPGSVPASGLFPAGCRFAPRCPLAASCKCANGDHPGLSPLGDDAAHLVRCPMAG